MTFGLLVVNWVNRVPRWKQVVQSVQFVPRILTSAIRCVDHHVEEGDVWRSAVTARFKVSHKGKGCDNRGQMSLSLSCG